MKFALLPLLAAAALCGQSSQSADDSSPDMTASDLNVNSRYIVESIDFTRQHHYRLSNAVVEEMHRLVGSKLNDEAVRRLAQRIRRELRAQNVTFRLARGGEPGSVKVLLEVDRGNTNFDLSVPKFAYNSSQGWTVVSEATAGMGDNAVSLGVLTDGDTLAERFSGLQAKYIRHNVAGDRLSLGLEFDAYHEQYNPATLAAFDSSSTSTLSSLGAGAYRSRTNLEPSATFVLAKPLTLTVGLSFERLDPQVSAAPSESANAVINTLRYHQRWSNSDATVQELDAGYNLRAATKFLATDLAYTRHAVNVRYGFKHDSQSVEVALVAGLILGRAPLFERFVLGNSATLRGWNKFDIDPLGGNRVVHGSVTYGYHIMRVFYDAGAVWDQGQSPDPKHSVGIGISSGLGLFQKGAFLLAVAFPIRQGRADPVFIAGMNF
jgi:outer membrane protein assembly factor BamA